MLNIKLLQRQIKFIVLITMLVATSYSVSAQQLQIITATGTIGDVAYCGTGCDLTITFPPVGGPVTGNGVYQGGLIRIINGGESTMACPGTATYSMTGSFAGGDGGAASGTFSWELMAENSDCTMHGTYKGSWSGNFYANGIGSGNLHVDTSNFDQIGQSAIGMDAPWQVTFSAEEFQAALGQSDSAPVAPEDAPSGIVTSETIYNTYGIKVEDSFGDDKWAKKAWSDEELTLLNDVLKELPPALLNKLSLTSIVRNQTNLDEHGNPKTTYGVYTPCDRTKGNEPCDPATDATIRIFDNALDPKLYTNDPQGYKSFKATILHELTHALQYHKEDAESALDPLHRNKSGYTSPFMQNYMDATRPVTDMNDPGYWRNNGWGTHADGTWGLAAAPGNQAPTEYGKKNPKEDMAEAVKLYVYDPQKLQGQSMQRYNFVRDQIFGGIEYEDGHQK